MSMPPWFVPCSLRSDPSPPACSHDPAALLLFLGLPGLVDAQPPATEALTVRVRAEGRPVAGATVRVGGGTGGDRHAGEVTLRLMPAPRSGAPLGWHEESGTPRCWCGWRRRSGSPGQSFEDHRGGEGTITPPDAEILLSAGFLSGRKATMSLPGSASTGVTSNARTSRKEERESVHWGFSGTD